MNTPNYVSRQGQNPSPTVARREPSVRSITARTTSKAGIYFLRLACNHPDLSTERTLCEVRFSARHHGLGGSMSPATVIHNIRQIPDGLDADAPLEAPHRRTRPLGTSALQTRSAKRRGSYSSPHAWRIFASGPARVQLPARNGCTGRENRGLQTLSRPGVLPPDHLHWRHVFPLLTGQARGRPERFGNRS